MRIMRRVRRPKRIANDTVKSWVKKFSKSIALGVRKNTPSDRSTRNLILFLVRDINIRECSFSFTAFDIVRKDGNSYGDLVSLFSELLLHVGNIDTDWVHTSFWFDEECPTLTWCSVLSGELPNFFFFEGSC